MEPLPKKSLFGAMKIWSQIFTPDDDVRSGVGADRDSAPWVKLLSCWPPAYTGARAEAAYCQAPLLTQTFCWSGSVGWHCGMSKPAIESLFELVDGNDAGAAYVFSSDPEADVHWTFVVTHEDEHRYLYKKIG